MYVTEFRRVLFRSENMFLGIGPKCFVADGVRLLQFLLTGSEPSYNASQFPYWRSRPRLDEIKIIGRNDREASMGLAMA